MTNPPQLFPSIPALILLAGLVLEFAAWGWRRKRPDAGSGGWRFALWTVRPWAAWGAFNLLFRRLAEWGFNDCRTFPFFARLWNLEASFCARVQELLRTPTVWLWGGITLGLLCLLAGWAVWALRSERVRPFPALLTLFLLTVALHFSLASLPDGAWEKGHRSSVLSQWKANTSMLYAIPFIKGSSHYFENFLEIQPRLRVTIHGLSHPPAASLSLWWIGRAMGTSGEDIRDPATRMRYTIGLILFGSLNLFILYGLGRSLFGRQAGILAALLWATAPGVAAYAGYAQDPVYAVFFNLALLLGWHVVSARRHLAWIAAGLGTVFFALFLLNYSWCLMTTIFVLLALAVGWRSGWIRRDWAVRVILPLAVMTVLDVAFLLYYRLDYWAMYQCSSHYVNQWYLFTGSYQWIMALIGGQFDLFLLLGSVTCSAFAVSLARLRRVDLADPRIQYLLIVLGVFALPLLFGPTCLKMETARCWSWVASLPLCFAADRLLRTNSRLFVLGAPAVGILTYAGMRLFLTFSP